MRQIVVILRLVSLKTFSSIGIIVSVIIGTSELVLESVQRSKFFSCVGRVVSISKFGR